MEIFKNTEGYSPLVTNLEGYWEMSFEDLPEALKPLVKRGFSIKPWSGLDAAARRIRAQGYDSRNDPEHEPSTYYEVAKFYSDAEDNEKKAHDKSNHTETVIWRDVRDRLNSILDIDRGRVGAEIQELKRKVSDNEKLESEVTQLRLENAEFKKNNKQASTDLSDRGEITYLNIIGAMLDLFLSETPSGNPYSVFKTQADIIETLKAHHKGKQGISKRNLEDKFADANRQLTKADDS